jgi:hypothetical protein
MNGAQILARRFFAPILRCVLHPDWHRCYQAQPAARMT